ncbi:Cytochrome P450 [Dillenia turbinata]|uniref:Cytochrome P450 n=1 Tax=Dillenia turbinata TaxID=194707 RepID=A0AAN8UXS5_9MAGN
MQLQQCREKLTKIFRAELKKRKQNRLDGVECRNDLMDGLMDIKDDEGNQLCDEETLDNIISLIVGGYVSTSLALTWAIYFIAKSPQVFQKLRKKHYDLPTFHNFRSDRPPKMWNMKRIPKVWQILPWVRYIHTNPENYENPMCFNPNRWNEPARPGAFSPFGGGIRHCPGNMLSRQQLALFLHHLCAAFKWELVNPEAEIRYLPHPKPTEGAEIIFSKF